MSPLEDVFSVVAGASIATPISLEAILALRDVRPDPPRALAVPPSEVGVAMLVLIGVEEHAARDWMRRQGVNL